MAIRPILDALIGPPPSSAIPPPRPGGGGDSLIGPPPSADIPLPEGDPLALLLDFLANPGGGNSLSSLARLFFGDRRPTNRAEAANRLQGARDDLIGQDLSGLLQFLTDPQLVANGMPIDSDTSLLIRGLFSSNPLFKVKAPPAPEFRPPGPPVIGSQDPASIIGGRPGPVSFPAPQSSPVPVDIPSPVSRDQTLGANRLFARPVGVRTRSF